MSNRKPPTFFLHAQPMIEIVGLPSGDHPEWVRREWIGLSLPLATQGVHRLECTSVRRNITSKWGFRIARWLGQTKWVSGYLVYGSEAVDVLRRKSPEAAAWWRETAPHLLDGQRFLIFEEPVCRVYTPEPPTPANR